MRYCNSCHTYSPGQPLFCATCGGTYDVRVCPRLHINPRTAQVCSQCGSRDLSQPQPSPPLLTKWTTIAVRAWLFLLLLLLSLLTLIAFVDSLLRDGETQGQLLAVLTFLSVCWYGYTRLPGGVRRAVGWLIKRGSGNVRGRH